MAFKTPEERQQARMLLQMAVLAATMGGRSFDDELQQLIDRALKEDESVDLEDLLRRVNDHLPNTSSTDPATWTFNDGLRASCKYFSIAIPDGFRVLTDYEEGLLSTVRPFVAVPNEIEDKDVPNADRLVCGAMPMPPLESFDKHGIDELAVMAIRSTMNTTDLGSPKVPEDWVVQGKNCSVLITRMDNGCTGYEYWIRPAIPQIGHYVRCIFSNSDAAQAETAKDTLTAMAKSVEATHPIESELTRQLDRISTQRVKPAEFNAAVEHLRSVLIVCRDRNHEANRAQYLANAEHPNNYDLTEACVLGLEAFFKRVWPLYKKLENAILFQRDKGASELELAAESNVLADSYALFLVNYLADSKGSAEYLREHGPVHRPSGYPQRLCSSARFCKGKYHELYELLEENEKELKRSIRQHINDPEESHERPARDDEPGDDAREDEPGDAIEGATCDEPNADVAEDAACDDKSADPTYDEPFGVDYPALVMTLLSDDWIFFEDDEIAWDGHHHAATGAQLNGAKVDGLLDFVNSCIPGFDDVTEVFQYFISFLNEVEKDEGLIVPRDMIAPGVQQAIREGDLTGLTLANLAACARALSVEKLEPGTYRVIFDGRLISGIPRFLDLVARLVWDLRQCTKSMRGKPFEIGFLQARNIDADHFLGSVDAPVPGAQEYAMFMKVTEAPCIALPDASEDAEYQEQASVELSPEDDMALDFVYALVRDFPCSKPISGTHHLGRAGRIEHVRVGDSLILAADWNCEFFDPAGIEVFNEQGETLGYLEGVIGPTRGALALILPHITATVESVTPLSKRRKGSKYALMDVHMELDDDATVEGILNVDPSSELLAQARGLLIRPKSERTVMSHANIDISQLKGRMDVSSFPQVESATSEVSHDETAAKTPSTADGTERQKNREAARTEYERLRNERRAAEEEAATAERIEQVGSAIEGFKEELQARERGIRDASDAACQAANDSFDRPARREALYRFYTAELERDLELTRLTRFLHAIDNMDLGPIDISSLPIEHGSATIGPLLKETESCVSDHADRLVRIRENRKNDKFWAFKKPYRDRILEHLIETGEDLTRQQIEEDLDETEGLYWNPPEGPGLKLVDFEAFLRNIPSPGPDIVSQLHYRRMLMDESHGAQKELSRLMAEIEQWEEMLSGDLEFTKSERSALEAKIKALQDRIVQAESLAEMAEDRERDYLKHRALFYIKDQATVIPQNAEIEHAAFLATRPVAKPEKTEPAKSNVPTGSAQPREKPNTAATPAATAASDVTANTSGNAAGGLILPIAAVIGFVGGCIYGGPFPGFLLAAFTTISAWITINELKK